MKKKKTKVVKPSVKMNEVQELLDMTSLEFDANHGHVVKGLKDVIKRALEMVNRDDDLSEGIDYLIRKAIESGSIAGYSHSQKKMLEVILIMAQSRLATMKLMRDAIAASVDEDSHRKLIELVDNMISEYARELVLLIPEATK